MPYYKNIVKNFRLSTLAMIMGAASILSIVPASALAQDNLPSRQFYYELNQYENAIGAFENAVHAGGLLPAEAIQMKLNIAQLRIANGQYSAGATALEDYVIRGGELKPQFIEMLVQAWVQADEPSKALPWAEQWFETAAPKERKHYDLMNYLYANLGMKTYQADIISQMILLWPEDKSLRSTLARL